MLKPNFFLPFIVFFFCCFSSSAQGWQWAQKMYHSPGYVQTNGKHITTDTAGNIFSATSRVQIASPEGTAHMGSKTVTDSTYCGQMLVMKLNKTGVCQWMFGTQHSGTGVVDIVTTKAGELYVFGVYDSTSCRFGNYLLSNTGSNPYSNVMYFLAKVSSAGNVLWAKNVAPGFSSGLGLGTPYITTYYPQGGMEIDKDGNIYINGYYTEFTVDIGSTTLTNSSLVGGDIFLAKYDPSGSVLWAKSFGGAGYDLVSASAITKDGDLLLAGDYMSASQINFGTVHVSNTDNDGSFLVKIDKNGVPVWGKGADTFADYRDVAVDNDERVYVTGFFYSDTIRFGAHTLTSTDADIYSDAFLVQYDSSGNTTWAKSASGTTSQMGAAVCVDECDNIFMAGSMTNEGVSPSATQTIYFGSTALTSPVSTSSYCHPMFIARYDASGNYVNGITLPSGGALLTGITADNKGNFLIAGSWQNETYTFGSNVIQPDTQGYNLLIAKYKYDLVPCDPAGVGADLAPVADVLLYPNPASAECAIHSDVVLPVGSVADLVDIMGHTVASYPVHGNSSVIPLRGIIPGMYTLRINSGGQSIIKRLVVVQ